MNKLRACFIPGLLGLTFLAAPAARAQTSGRVHALTVPSKLYSWPRRIWVYTPAGYSANASAYDLLIAFDGAEQKDPKALPLVLDTLIAKKRIPPHVAVMIDDSSGAVRTGELGNSARFNEFLVNELMPFVRARYNVTRDPHHTIITGSSAGGLGAANAAFHHPEMFGKVLSQSGAFWRGNEGSNAAPYEWLTSQYAAQPKKDIVLLLDVGQLETRATLGGTGPVFIEATRRFHDTVSKKGYRVFYTEVPNGVHAPETWNVRFPIDLVQLVAARQ